MTAATTIPAPTGADATGPRRSGLTPAQRSSLWGLLFVSPAVVLLVVFFALPVLMTVVMSFFDWPLFGRIEPVGVDNYLRIAADDLVRSSIGFTLGYTVVITVVSFMLSFALALLVQKGGRAVGLFRTVYFLPSAIGMAFAGLLWGFLYNGQVGVFSNLLQLLGLADGPVLFLDTPTSAVGSVVIMVLWKSVGLTMLVMLVGLQSIPVELYEAARVDGASWWRQLTGITLPLMRPTFALLLVLGVSGALLSFDQFFVLTAGGPDRSTITVVYAIYRSAFTQYQLGYAAALGIVLMLILIAVNVVQLRFLRTKDSA